MATYNAAAVADSVIAYQKGITLQQGRALRDNPIAIAEGASGAPKVVRAALNTTLNTVTGSVSSGATVYVDLGATSFFPSVVFSGTASLGNSVVSDADNPGIKLVNSGGSSASYTIKWRSIA